MLSKYPQPTGIDIHDLFHVSSVVDSLWLADGVSARSRKYETQGRLLQSRSLTLPAAPVDHRPHALQG
jgi:hypothetical protein